MKSKIHNEKNSSIYGTPKLRIVELKTKAMLCQSRDIKNAGEDYEDIFDTEEE